ncbi:MAG: glutamine--fructose-6-phosphate transaminase (isomerizing) [Nitrospinae bacterium]|nr:glutamine--fructose-6-phosphate transaminase (isomerizing) [Nitrospinota bacterium]
MCGISGIISSNTITKKLLNSIQNLEYRGYDSCGMAIINSHGPVIRKNIGHVADVAEKELFLSMDGYVGIAHTRWATHGGVTPANAHPHANCDGSIAVVHNGIISNYLDLKQTLIKKRHHFISETDSEVIPHLIEEYRKGGMPLESAFSAALKELEGSFAVAMVAYEEPGRIFCAKHESPLIIGLGNNENYLGSDFNAFIEYTKDAVVMDDGEYAIISNEGYAIKRIGDGSPVLKKVMQIEWDAEMSKKGGFPHYMLKEIYEQPETVNKALAISQEAIISLARGLVDSRRAFLTGVGTTFYAAQIGQYYLASEAGLSIPAISSDEFLESTPAGEGDFVLAVSQSGETYDTLRVLREAKNRKAKTAAIVNVIGSTMARLVDTTVMQGSGPEICVISTKAALAQMVILIRTAIEAGIITGKLTPADRKAKLKQLETLPGLISDFLNEHSAFVHNLAKRQAHHHNWLYLGRGKYYPIALEAALKVKEVAYLHTEGMPAGFLKHGTIALIDEKLKCLVFVPTEKEHELYKMTMSSIEEIKARGGSVVAIHSSRAFAKSPLLDDQLLLPSAPPLVMPLVALVASQLLSYFFATTLGRNVDKPRALAKSVTVA